jgi:hypothetical protein
MTFSAFILSKSTRTIHQILVFARELSGTVDFDQCQFSLFFNWKNKCRRNADQFSHLVDMAAWPVVFLSQASLGSEAEMIFYISQCLRYIEEEAKSQR